jgi:hypothetical protein
VSEITNKNQPDTFSFVLNIFDRFQFTRENGQNHSHAIVH